MIKTREDIAARILRPLSQLLKMPLELDRATGEVRAVGGRTLDAIELRLIDEVLQVAGEGEKSGDTRLRALEQRVAELQRENKQLESKNTVLADISARDSLTGLYNRWYVREKIDSEMNRAMRHGYPMSVLMLDLDHFKQINDSYGHPAGDSVLRSVGQMLRESCRVYDVPGRYGGEEFCIVLPETKVNGTTTVAERIRSRLETTRLSVGDSSIVVTASIGIAGVDSVSEDGVLSASMLVERADRALYAAKHQGRNRVELWEPARSASH